MGEDLEEVVFNLRAIIVSNKGPIDLRNLSRDYATVVGSPIPYRSFNHHSLEDFLRSIESLRVCRSGDQILVEAAASAASRHVSELISRQKSTGKKSSFAPPPRGSYRGRGYRGRGRGSYPSRPYTTRPYRDWDQPAQDYSSRDYSAGPSRNHSTREQPSRDQATRDYHDNGDYGHSSSGPKRYSPNSHRYNTASAAPPLTVKVDRDDSRQVSFKNELPPRLQRKRQQDAENAASSASSPVSPSSQVSFKNELPPRLQRKRQQNAENAASSATSPVSPSSQMGPKIQCLGSSYAKEIVDHLKIHSSNITISKFFHFPNARINHVEKMIMREKHNINPKIPLLVLLGENDVIIFSEKIKVIINDYISLILLIKKTFPFMHIILIHLPICTCSYNHQNHFERKNSFNQYLSEYLEIPTKGLHVVNFHNTLLNSEYFNCGNGKMRLEGCHLNKKGYSKLVEYLVSQLLQSFNSVDKSTDASNSSAIISPLGPSQLIAKAKEQQLQQQRNGTSHYSLSNRGYDLSADFSHLSHEDTYSSRDGSASVGNQHFSNRQNQIPENLPLLESEVGSLEPDEINLRNNVEILLKYCLSQGWSPPKYKITSKWFKDQRNEIKLATVEVFCDLSIGHIKGNSFPSIETGSEMDAKGMAAKIALEKIRNETSKVKADKTISSDKNLICNRISDIVAGISTGMFAKSVEDEYSRKYNEVLPPDWTYIVSGWPTLDVESTFFSKIIVPRVSPRVVEPVLLEPCLAPPPLPLEEVGDADGIEDVFITHATSVSHVWFRVIGNFSDEYEILLKKMDEYYKGQGAQELILTCEVGQYYAAHSLDTWFRVCVVEVNEAARTALAWLVDHGDKEEFQFESLYRLAPQFCQLPRQAVQCSLEGLESFSDDAVAYEVVSTSEYLIGKSLVAKITYKDIDSGFVKANLYDTSGEDDVLVNELIKDEIIAKSKPVLPAEGCAMEVAIGDVSKKGEVYIMFPGPSFDRISDIIDGLGPEKIKEHKLASFKHISLNKMYLAKFSKDENWYRAVVTATPSVQHNKIPVRFIDFGNAESVNISDIADLENLPPILRKLPPQAVKVALHNLPIESMTVNEVARLRSLLLDDEDKVVMIKTFSLKADPPVVEIFTKEAPKGNGDEAPALVSVNFTIEAQRKLNRPEENHKSIELVSPDASLNLSVNNNQDDFVLKAPAFQVSEFQPVLVVLAAHPDNFIFQPTKYANDMKKLRQQMVAYYETGTLPEVPTHRIVQNKLFAARYTDDMWYRVMVMGSPLGSNVPVRLCDHGDVTSVQISALRELAPEFLEYPFMAVKGKLSGVMPVDEKDWTPLDCVRFQTLVLNEILAGIVVEVQEDNENPMEMVVTLTLIDTNTDKDLDIAAILVQENRAVRIN